MLPVVEIWPLFAIVVEAFPCNYVYNGERLQTEKVEGSLGKQSPCRTPVL